MARNVLRQVKNVIYRLKRNYGLTVVFYKITGDQYDFKTGEVDRDAEAHTVKRCVVLPFKELKKFEYDLAYIATSKNFTYGALYDYRSRILMLDKDDISVDITDDMYCVFNSERYQIKEINLSEDQQAYLIIVTRIDGDV